MTWQKNLWTLWVACILSSASYTMILPFLPLFLLALGVGEGNLAQWSGAVLSVSFVVGAIMGPVWGKLADNAGKKRMVIRAGLSLATVYFLTAVVKTPEQLFVVRLLQGFAAGFIPAAMAIVSSSVPPERLGFSLGLMQSSTLTGSILGPVLGGLISHFFGMRTSFMIASACLYIGTLAVYLLVQEPNRETKPEPSRLLDDIKTAIENRLLLLMLGFIVAMQMAMMVMQAFVTLYIARFTNAQDVALTAGVIFGLAGLAGVIAAPLWGRAGQRSGYHLILACGFIGAGLVNIMQGFQSTLMLFAVLHFCFGFFLAAISPAINGIIVALTPVEFRGRAFGLSMTAVNSGSMIGPLFGATVVTAFSIPALFALTGAILLAIGSTLFYHRTKLAEHIPDIASQ